MSKLPIDLPEFARRTGSWLSAGGPEADVVLSCRVRLARNLAGQPFIPRLDPPRALEIAARLEEALVDLRLDGGTVWVPLAEAPPLLRLMLRERHLISREMSPSEDGEAALPGRALAFGPSEAVAVMVNEEDHVRLQAIAPGLQIDAAWRAAQELDRALEARVPYAWTRQLGYLTGCPTNVGTGLRASVMLHLPALGMVRPELEKVFAATQRTGLAVRGMYGEGSRAAGDLYQVSNQITLGRSENQLLEDLRALVPCIVEFERKVRATLLEQQRALLRDRVSRSLGLLRTARAMATDSALAHLSSLRLGLALGLIEAPAAALLRQLGVQVQKAHVQALCQRPLAPRLLEASERDRLRAGLLRRSLAEGAA